MPPLVFGIKSRCNMPPGRRCWRAARSWSITAVSGRAGSGSWPSSIFSRSAVRPIEPSGLENVWTSTDGGPWRAGRVKSNRPWTDTAITCGRRLSAAKNAGTGSLFTMTLTWAALAQRSSRG